MKITLNAESWHSRYYKWVLKSKNLPKSLCPYFWILLLFLATAPFIVFGKCISWIFTFAGKIFKKKKKELTWEEEMEKELKRNRFYTMVGKIFFGFLALLFLFVFIALMYGAHQKHTWSWIIHEAIYIIGLVTTFIGLFWLAIETIRWMKLERITETKLWISIGNGWNVMIGFLVASKEKVCPIIDWTNK